MILRLYLAIFWITQSGHHLNVMKKERSININIKYNRGVMSILVMNAYANNINVTKNVLPVTTKDDSFEHGIGLANVRNTVEKYHGELIIKTENKKFIADIILYI